MDRSEALASMLLDEAITDSLMPWACPCDFGPSARYRLVELVGIGRHSLVFRAQDRHLSSEGFSATVAIKVLRDRSGHAREALAARRINHPNVLAVLDHGLIDGGVAYVVCEYIDGGDLSEAAVPWPPRQAAAFVLKAARGVQAAHSAGVVHCDLKPANIMLTLEGDPKLVDFDLSHWGADDGSTARGNLAFMSPEQFRGDPASLTPPSDIYALGGLLYYLLTGKLPNGETRAEVGRAHAAAQPIPGPSIQRDLDRICRKAMAHAREDRYHSAGELADDLERWLRHEPIPWTRPGPIRRFLLVARRRPVRTILAAAGVAAVATALGVMEYNAAKERERVVRVSQEAAAETKREVARISERVRSHIRFFAQAALAGNPTDVVDSVLPTLVWLQFLSDFPVLREDGRVPDAADRERLLRAMVDAAEGEGRANHVDALLAKSALAHFLLGDGEWEEPTRLIADLRAGWQARLDPRDPIWQSLDAMDACAEANRAMREHLPIGPARDHLATTAATLSANGRNVPMRRLVDRIALRLPKDRE
jgi:hypothetical protein